MRHLRIDVLGGLCIDCAEAQIVLSRKNKAVLVALALAGPRGLARDSLADLFWGERGLDQARASLRQALAAIRKALGPIERVLAALPDRVALDATSLELDAVLFETLADSSMRGDLERAARLYRGDLLDGVPLNDGAFVNWLQPKRERLRAKAIGVLARLLEDPETSDEQAVWAWELLALEQTNEAAHRALMRCYAARGRENAALKQFSACRDVLRRELGVAPSPETIRLFEAIRSKRRQADPETVEAPACVVATVEHNGSPARERQRPTITVFLFENLTGLPSQAYLVAGITRDVTSALWRHRSLTVISPSASANAGLYFMMVDGRVIESKVDYVVNGSVRLSGTRVRVGVELTESASGEHVWVDSFDVDLHEVIGLNDEIARIIAARIEPEISLRERIKAARKPASALEAWDCYHLGVHHLFRFTAADNAEAQRLFRRAVDMDADFPEGHAWWSYARTLSMFYYDDAFTESSLEQALHAASRAVELDEQNAVFQTILSKALLLGQKYDESLARMQLAVGLNPNLAVVYCGIGDALAYEGMFDRAIQSFETALALGPRDPQRWAFLGYGALAQIFAERFEEAATWANDATLHPTCLFWAYAHRVSALGHLGREVEAQAALSELRRRQPAFSREFAASKLFYIKNPDHLRLYLEGLRKAGVPKSLTGKELSDFGRL